MKKKKWKILIKGFIYLTVAVLFLGLMAFLNDSSNSGKEEIAVWQTEALENISGGWELAAETDYLELYFDPLAVQFIVKDKNTGAQWRSNPEGAEEDTIAFGQNKMAVQSVLEVTYVDDQSCYYVINSLSGSTREGKYTYEYGDNGVYLNLKFEKQGFEIPCFFGVEEDHFTARVLSGQIEQHLPLKIASISLLPYFGAGSMEDDGYMVVPDGSGALIRYNNQKQGYQSYSQKVYGRDLALSMQSNVFVAQDATMPVFGIRRNNDALLAVITEGEYQAEIKAEVSGKLTSNNVVYSSVTYIQKENNILLANSDREQVAVMLSAQQNQFSNYAVTYYFLEQDAGYSEMAARYRQYLVEEKGMRPGRSEEQKLLNLTFLGGVGVRRTMLGIPYHTVEPLTAYANLAQTALELQQNAGNSFQVSMTHLEKGGADSKLPTKLTYERALGGESGYDKMQESLKEAGIPFYPVYDPISVRKAGNGYRSVHGARNISKTLAYQYEYQLAAGNKDTSTSYYLVSPQYAEDIMGSLLADAAQKGISALGLSGITDRVYSDYRKNPVSANQTGQYWEDVLAMASGAANELLLQGAYAYAFPYADIITEVPLFSSRYDVEDDSIPFYQMAVGGYASLYSEPVNMCGNVKERVLKAIEYGVSPSFLLMTAEPEILIDTDYQKYYSVAYGEWHQMIQDELKELEILEGVLGQGIISHRKLQEDVYATTYKDGTVVYVNYGEAEVALDGVVVPAMGFTRKGDE